VRKTRSIIEQRTAKLERHGLPGCSCGSSRCIEADMQALLIRLSAENAERKRVRVRDAKESADTGWSDDGTPLFRLDDKTWVYADRFALEQRLGRPIRAGMDAIHSCGDLLCMNYAHLVEG